MQVVFDSFDAAKAACDKVNRGKRRPLSVYRVFDEGGREKFAIAIAPEQAIGRAGEFFGISAERWPRRTKETPQSLLDGMSMEQMRSLLEELKEQIKQRARRGQDA